VLLGMAAVLLGVVLAPLPGNEEHQSMFLGWAWCIGLVAFFSGVIALFRLMKRNGA